MTTPQKPSGTSSTPRHTGAAVPSVTGWLIDHAAVVQAVAYLCAGGFVVGLLAGATTVAWLLLAAALTAESATYGLRALRDRTHRNGEPPMMECGRQRNELHASGFHAGRDTGVALLAAYRRQQS